MGYLRVLKMRLKEVCLLVSYKLDMKFHCILEVAEKGVAARKWIPLQGFYFTIFLTAATSLTTASVDFLS